MNFNFQNVLSGVLTIGIIWVGAKAKIIYDDYKEKEQELLECKQVPIFELALADVAKFVGMRKRRYFETSFINTRKFEDFYDNNKKCFDTLIDVTI